MLSRLALSSEQSGPTHAEQNSPQRYLMTNLLELALGVVIGWAVLFTVGVLCHIAQKLYLIVQKRR